MRHHRRPRIDGGERIVGRIQPIDDLLHLRDVAGRLAARHGRRGEAAIGGFGLAHVHVRTRRVGHFRAELGKHVADSRYLVRDLGRHRRQRIVRPQRDAEFAEGGELRVGEIEPPCRRFAFDRPGHHVQGESQVDGIPRQRPAHRHVRFRHAFDQLVASLRHDAPGRLVAVDAAERRRGADGAADVRTGLQGAESRRRCSRAAAGRTARRTLQVPRIAGGAVDGVEALDVRELHRHVRLAEEVRARGAKAANGEAVALGDVVPLRLDAPGRWRVRHDVGLLDGHRQAVERAAYTASRQLLVGGFRVGEGALEAAHDHGVDLAVEALDALDVEPRQLDGADALVANELRQITGGTESEICAHGLSLLSAQRSSDARPVLRVAQSSLLRHDS